MPTVACPVEGFERVKVAYPDTWLLRHYDLYHAGRAEAPEGAAESTRETYGTIALCDRIDGLDLNKPAELPLYYLAFFRWLKDEVLLSYLKAGAVPKNS